MFSATGSGSKSTLKQLGKVKMFKIVALDRFWMIWILIDQEWLTCLCLLLISLKVGATSLDPTGPASLKHGCHPFRDMLPYVAWHYIYLTLWTFPNPMEPKSLKPEAIRSLIRQNVQTTHFAPNHNEPASRSNSCTHPVHCEGLTHNAAERQQLESNHNFTHSNGIFKDIHSKWMPQTSDFCSMSKHLFGSMWVVRNRIETHFTGSRNVVGTPRSDSENHSNGS